MLNSMRKHGTTLAVFAAVTTGLTAVVYALTKTTIAHQAALQQKALLDQVVPPENYDNIMQNECFLESRAAGGCSCSGGTGSGCRRGRPAQGGGGSGYRPRQSQKSRQGIADGGNGRQMMTAAPGRPRVPFNR